MQSKINPGFADRLTTQADAKKALLAKFKPKAAVVAPDGAPTREQLKAQEREAARAQRAASALADVHSALEAKRNERKDRKAAAKADARARREAKR